MKKKCIVTVLLAGLVHVAAADPPPMPTFRLLFDPGHLGYTQPGGITQMAPGFFLVSVDNAAILAVTKAGRGTVLVRDPAQGGLYPPAAASNGRAYTSFAGANSNTAKYVMSFSPESGSTASYPQQPAVPIFSAALPDGTLLGAGGDIEGYEHLLVSDLAGSVTSVYTFSASVVAQTPPFVGSDGNYYGVGYYRYSPGNAYVYQITPSGAFTQIASLPDGSFSYNNDGSALFQAADGNLYGTTLTGGNKYGTFYRVTLSGQYTLLYTFPAKSHNSFPGNMFQASDGNFYGVANGCCSGGPATWARFSSLRPLCSTRSW
jgi:hypothetical protein